jgi:hypothetical protein
LVANIDVAPTVLSLLEESANGREILSPVSMRVVPWERGCGPEDLVALSRQVTLNRAALLPVLGGAGVFAVLALGLIVAALVAPSSRRLSSARAALLTAASIPLALLIVPALRPTTLAAIVTATIACCATVALLAWVGSALLARRGRHVSGLLVLYLGTMLALGVDLLLGGQAIGASLLTDFPLAGFRFYGIGNEYAGLFVGMAAIGLAWATEPLPELRRALVPLFLGVAALIGLPWLGANFGDALTAAAAFVVTLWLLPPKRRRLSPGLLLSLLGLLIWVAVILFALDAARPAAERTHVGQLAERLSEGGLDEGVMLLAEVARRKFSMNRRLITAPITLAILTAVVPLLIVGYHGTKRRLSGHLAARPAFRAGVVGALAGGAVGFVVNDSGVVVWSMATAAALAAVLEALLTDPCG